MPKKTYHYSIDFISIQIDLVTRAQTDLASVLEAKAINGTSDAKTYCSVLMKLGSNSTPHDIGIQQYVFTRVEEVLGLQEEITDADSSVYGLHRAVLFTADGINVVDAPFFRAMTSSDAVIKHSSSLGLACLLSKKEGKLDEFMDILVQDIEYAMNASSGTGDIGSAVEYIMPALCMILRRHSARDMFIDKDGVNLITTVISKIGANGGAQQLYDSCFCLWALSLTKDVQLEPFLNAGTIRALIELVTAAPSRKVFRMSVSALANLASTEDSAVLTEMLTHGLEKTMEGIIHNTSHKESIDIETENDIRTLYELLMRNYRDLSTFERWASEVNTGALRWGIVHTDKFWRENCKFLEKTDFALLKTLISLLNHADKDPVVTSIALYDIGEFTRFYPNGKAVVKALGAHEKSMGLIGHPNTEIQRHALQCVSKIMVNNWEFMR